MSDKIESALSFIPADDRETWVSMGMAVKSELGESGYDVWNEWSQTASNYNARAALASWRSFKVAGGITLGTLLHEARINGWRDTSQHERPSAELLQARKRAAEQLATVEGQERQQAQQKAAKKAAWIMHQCKPEKHAYLHSKGWPELQGMVWRPSEDSNLLCIPMRIDDHLVGVQMIDKTGQKKFLSGQQTSRAEYVISNPGIGAKRWFVEGYATGLSLRDCLKKNGARYIIHITFSAGNMAKLADIYGAGIIIADNDQSGTGERIAKASGLPYWISEVQGEDFNDAHKRMGLFQLSNKMKIFMQNLKK